MGREHTDLKLLVKGLKYLVLVIPTLVLSAYLITFSGLNKDTLPIYMALIPGILAMIATIYLLFKGFKTILKSVFG